MLPKRREEKAALDKLAKEPERILADAKEARLLAPGHEVYGARVSPPPTCRQSTWLLPGLSRARIQTTATKETPPIDRGRFLGETIQQSSTR
jgi:hypothetical protein